MSPTGIEWTDETWNPVTGCSKVSPGCAHCYAETLSLRFGFSKKPWLPEHAAENVVLHPERLDQPLRWRKPRMIFVNSMSDLFHEQVPNKFIEEVFAVMGLAPQHTFQVLTKRPERMRSFLEWVHRKGFIASAARERLGFTPDFRWEWPLPNVWLGTSIENRRWIGRADDLRACPAAVRFISAEPLLGSLFLRDDEDYTLVEGGLNLDGIDWLIAGGESGAGHRLMDPRWARELRDYAQATGTAFFFKQWGGRSAKAGGKLLDGREWCEMPGQAVPA